jgi:hypothetical protein
MELAADVFPSAFFAVAEIRYFVPRSNCPFGFQDRPSAAISPGTSVPLSVAVIVTSVNLPPLTFTPVALMDAPVEPSFAEIVIVAAESLADASLPSPPLLSALASPPHPVSVNAPTTSTTQAPIARRTATFGLVTFCSNFSASA